MKEPELGRTRWEVTRRAWLRRCVVRGVKVSRAKSLLGWRVRRAAKEMASGPQENWDTLGCQNGPWGWMLIVVGGGCVVLSGCVCLSK